MHERKLSSLMKKMKESCKLDINQSVPKNILSVQKLRENNVEGIDIMQISGHKKVAFINNYSTLSEERHRKISNILSNTESETNRNALVPVQFSANLPRKTSTNSTASSTSDVSCRSNPDVPSISSNTNMSSQISSMFYAWSSITNGECVHNFHK